MLDPATSASTCGVSALNTVKGNKERKKERKKERRKERKFGIETRVETLCRIERCKNATVRKHSASKFSVFSYA